MQISNIKDQRLQILKITGGGQLFLMQNSHRKLCQTQK